MTDPAKVINRGVPRCAEYTSDPSCPNRLINPETGTRLPAGTKTCSRSCRDKRARRLKREAKQRQAAAAEARRLPAHLQPFADAAADKLDDAARDVAREMVRPVMRDAMTADVLRGIGSLVDLIPDAIDALRADIVQDGDEVDFDRRQKAYTLLLKYTAGNSTVAPPADEPAAAGMQVIFAMPRPGDTPTGSGEEAPQPPDAVELRDCVECEATKPVAEFVGRSTRCLDCQEILEKMIRDRNL